MWTMARGRKTGGRKAGTPNRSTAEVKALAQQYGAAALEKLAWLMHNAESDMTKLMACKEILDRAYGKPIVGSAMAASAEKTDHQLEQIKLFIVDPSPTEAVADNRQRRL